MRPACGNLNGDAVFLGNTFSVDGQLEFNDNGPFAVLDLELTTGQFASDLGIEFDGNFTLEPIPLMSLRP